MFNLTKILLLFCLINVLVWSSASVPARTSTTLSVTSDVWCPYVCDDNVLPGFLVEVVKEIAKDHKIKLTFSLTPLARALSLAQKGKVDILLALTPQHITDYQLQQSLLSFGGLYNDFYVTTKKQWHFQGISNLEIHLNKGAILGTINGYQYGNKIDRMLRDNSEHVFSASGNSPLTKQLKMLQMGRLDILLDSRFTVQYQLSKMPNNSIIYAGTQGNFTPLFLGFSPLVDKGLVSVFDQGLKSLRQDGRLEKILVKYGIQDWQQQSLFTENKNQD